MPPLLPRCEPTALDTTTRIYQRLLAGDVEEAIELATEQAEAGDIVAFYNETGVPVLRMATSDHASVATAEHRHRVVVGMDALIEDLREQSALAEPDGPHAAVCIGGKWEDHILTSLTNPRWGEGAARPRRRT